MPRTIAQMAILNWVETHFGITNMEVRFTEKREALVVDRNGDALTLRYDSDTREVYAV